MIGRVFLPVVVVVCVSCMPVWGASIQRPDLTPDRTRTAPEAETPPAQPIEVQVDCGTGGDLGEVIARRDFLTVYVTGVCEGNFAIEADHVRIVGDGTDTTVLRGTAVDDQGDPTAPTLRVEGATDVQVSGLAIENGYQGLLVRRSSISLDDVVVRDNLGYGLWFGPGANANVTSARIEAHDFAGLLATATARVNLADSEIGGSPYGVFAHGDAEVELVRSRVDGTEYGLWLYRSFLVAHQGSEITGGMYGAVVADRSELELQSASSVDGGSYGINQDADSHVELFGGSRVGGAIYSFILRRGSSANLYDATVEGPIYNAYFSAAYLSNTVVHGFLYCVEAQGAICSDSTITEWVSCPGTCVSTPFGGEGGSEVPSRRRDGGATMRSSRDQ